jgi:hypothetical protein
MSAYILQANNINQTTPVLKKGQVKISAAVAVYWTVGENPIAVPGKSALLSAGQILDLRIPVKCSKISVLAVKDTGTVVITEHPGGASSSCS